MRRGLLLCLLLGAVGCGPGPSLPVDGGPTSDGGVDGGADAGQTVHFSSDVLPLLQTHCTGCHGDPSPAGGFNLAGDAAAVYPEVRARVSLEDPPSSLLLTKMAGQNHGRFFGPGDVEYEQTLAWIAAGAPND
ncbi:MAG: hypothetical protein D6729_02885 [Deltaproteobacteria bacterium]|nr:MAG: hypothetical protein D6729_02885 [Deltaproteobacteria bacterium]